jgi:hypothetical protein
VAVAADSPLTVAGAAPVFHRTSLSHRKREAITGDAAPSPVRCHFDQPDITCRVEQRRGG